MKKQLKNNINERLDFLKKLEEKIVTSSTEHTQLLKELHEKGDELKSDDYVALKLKSMLLNLMQQDFVKVKSKLAESYTLYKLEYSEDKDAFPEIDTKVLNQLVEDDVFLFTNTSGEIVLKNESLEKTMTDRFRQENFDKEVLKNFLSKASQYND